MSSARSILLQIVGWLGLWGVWVVISRHNHPSWLLNAIATALLVATFASAVYAHHLVLIPGLLRRGRLAAYLAGLLFVTVVLALACTQAIGLVYDVLVGPDPRRFGFLTNFAMELGGVLLHVGSVALCVWLWTLLRREHSSAAANSELPCTGG